MREAHYDRYDVSTHRKIREPVVAKFNDKCQRITEVRVCLSLVAEARAVPVPDMTQHMLMCDCRRWCARRAIHSWGRGR